MSGAAAGGVRAGRVQRLRVRVRADGHGQDAHHGGHGGARGRDPARLPPHVGAHREQRLARRHAPRLLLLHRALPRGRARPARQGLQEAYHQGTGTTSKPILMSKYNNLYRYIYKPAVRPKITIRP